MNRNAFWRFGQSTDIKFITSDSVTKWIVILKLTLSLIIHKYLKVGVILMIFGTVLKSMPFSFWCPRYLVENKCGFRRWHPKDLRRPAIHSTPPHPICFRLDVVKHWVNFSRLAAPKEGRWLEGILKLHSSVYEFCIVVELRLKWICWFWKMVSDIFRGTSIGPLLCKPFKKSRNMYWFMY